MVGVDSWADVDMHAIIREVAARLVYMLIEAEEGVLMSMPSARDVENGARMAVEYPLAQGESVPLVCSHSRLHCGARELLLVAVH